MKTFVIINGTILIYTIQKNMEDAITKAENISNHSNEIIVREITEIINPITLK